MAKLGGFTAPTAIDPALAAQIMQALGQSGQFLFDYGENAADPDWGRKPPKLNSLSDAVDAALKAKETPPNEPPPVSTAKLSPAERGLFQETVIMPAGMGYKMPGVRGTGQAQPRSWANQSASTGQWNQRPGSPTSSTQDAHGNVTQQYGANGPSFSAGAAPAPWQSNAPDNQIGNLDQPAAGGAQQTPSVYGQPGTGQPMGGGNAYAPPNPTGPMNAAGGQTGSAAIDANGQGNGNNPPPPDLGGGSGIWAGGTPAPTQTPQGYPINNFGGPPPIPGVKGMGQANPYQAGSGQMPSGFVSGDLQAWLTANPGRDISEYWAQQQMNPNPWNNPLNDPRLRTAPDLGPVGNDYDPSNPLTWRKSDVRLKSNIQRVGTHPLGVGIYDYDIDGRRERGVLAQELLPVLPYAVRLGSDGYYEVNYAALT